MSVELQYHSVKPSNDIASSSGFSEYNTIDFNLVADGRKMISNSIRICGELEVYSNNLTKVVVTDDIKMNHSIGIHGFFESWQCETAGGKKKPAQVLENLQSYPRYCVMEASVQNLESDYCSASKLAELRGALAANGKINCEPVSSNTAVAVPPTLQNATFAMAPRICWNRMSGAQYSFADNGDIKISCNLARVNQALSGSGVGATGVTPGYSLKNVRLTYQSVPEDNKGGAIMMESYVNVKSTLVSTSSNVQATVPSKKVSGCSISFLTQSVEADPLTDTYRLEQYPLFSELNFQFQDTLNRGITYNINRLQDAVAKGIKSFPNGRIHNNRMHVADQATQQGTILGSDFGGQMLDLTGQKFGVNIKSDYSSLSQENRIAYLYFHTLLLL